jgi:steroid delta-isomerase-like uncharacterized protein
LSDKAQTLVRCYYDALNRKDFNSLDEILAPNLVHHGIRTVTSRDALKAMLIAYREGFPDLRHSIEDVVVQVDRIAIRTTTSGTQTGPFLGHPPSGRSFTATALSLYRLDSGLIQEIWEVFDTLSMLQQIGLYSHAPNSSGQTNAPEPLPSSMRRARNVVEARPPGPKNEVSLADIRSHPLGFLERLADEYGDYVRYVCDGRETILLNQPAAVRHVMHDRASNYSKLDTPDLLLLKPMLGEGLLTTVGPVWKRDRQWLQPFFSRRQIEGADRVMVHVTEEMLARWNERTDRDTPIDISREMSRLTLEIAAQVLFSTDFASQSEAFGRAVDTLNESMASARPDAADTQREFQPALAFIRRAVWQIILARKFYDTGEDDLLASLLRLQHESGDSDGHLVDQAVTILLAGHETTAKALTWAIALLDANPRTLDLLLTEVNKILGDGRPTANQLPTMQYTRAVIDETLRLYPPIWLLTRTALEDDNVADYDIPAGALVAISPYLLHRHPSLWERPATFLPERFLGNDGYAQDYKYLPFGHGPRHCIGKFFALFEMPLVLGTIYPQYVLKSSADYTCEPEALVTLRPRDGLPMTVTARGRRM